MHGGARGESAEALLSTNESATSVRPCCGTFSELLRESCHQDKGHLLCQRCEMEDIYAAAGCPETTRPARNHNNNTHVSLQARAGFCTPTSVVSNGTPRTDRDAPLQQGRELVTQGLSSARSHDDKRVPAGEGGVHDLLRYKAEQRKSNPIQSMEYERMHTERSRNTNQPGEEKKRSGERKTFHASSFCVGQFLCRNENIFGGRQRMDASRPLTLSTCFRLNM